MKQVPESLTICGIFKTIWEEDPIYRGQVYFITGHDRSSAKILLEGNGDVPRSAVMIRAKLYLRSPDPFYRKCKHPAHFLFERFSEFTEQVAPERSEIIVGPKGIPINCDKCGGNHGADEPC